MGIESTATQTYTPSTIETAIVFSISFILLLASIPFIYLLLKNKRSRTICVRKTRVVIYQCISNSIFLVLFLVSFLYLAECMDYFVLLAFFPLYATPRIIRAFVYFFQFELSQRYALEWYICYIMQRRACVWCSCKSRCEQWGEGLCYCQPMYEYSSILSYSVHGAEKESFFIRHRYLITKNCIIPHFHLLCI